MVEWIKEEKNLAQIVREGNLFAKNVVPKKSLAQTAVLGESARHTDVRRARGENTIKKHMGGAVRRQRKSRSMF
jgi:hypothetical protein